MKIVMQESIANEKLWRKIKINPVTDCWEWQGAYSSGKYGCIRRKGKTMRTHRLFFEIFKGAIPKGLYILHTCDNTKCCNPEHLYAGTQLDNMSDMDKRGRRNPPRGDRNAMRINSLKGEKNGRSKLKEADISQIRRLLSEGKTKSLIAKMFGVSRMPITGIANGQNWSHV